MAELILHEARNLGMRQNRAYTQHIMAAVQQLEAGQSRDSLGSRPQYDSYRFINRLQSIGQIAGMAERRGQLDLVIADEDDFGIGMATLIPGPIPSPYDMSATADEPFPARGERSDALNVKFGYWHRGDFYAEGATAAIGQQVIRGLLDKTIEYAPQAYRVSMQVSHDNAGMQTAAWNSGMTQYSTPYSHNGMVLLGDVMTMRAATR